MNNKTFYWVILIIVLCLTPGGYSQDPRVKSWEEDIDYLTQRLEIMHPNPYAHISREVFLEAADELKQKIPSSTDVEMVFGMQELNSFPNPYGKGN